MKVLLLMLTVCFCLASCSALTCTPQFCYVVDCFPVTQAGCNGVFVKNGGMCGCCDACYPAIEPGQPCEPLDQNNPPKGLCKNGYWCDNGICRILLPGK